jgi:hypothetical protein
MVDYTALRVNQSFIMGLLALAFVTDWLWLVAFVALVMLLGTAVPQAALFKQIYRQLLRPAGLLQPDPVADHTGPHQFAQGLGGAVLVLATVALWLGAPLVGWTLVGIVIFLAALNLFVGFCAGCFMYYQLGLGSKVAE